MEIDGRRVDGLSEGELVTIRRGTIGYVFQQFHLIPTLTTHNLALAQRCDRVVTLEDGCVAGSLER